MQDRPIRVLYALPSFSIGGIERQLLAVAPELVARGLEVSLVTLFEYPGRVDLYGELDPRVAVARAGRRPDGRPRGRAASLVAFVRAVRAARPDVVVASMSSAHLAALVARIFCRFALVLREHNAYDDKRPWHWAFDRVAARFAAALVAVSGGVADYAAAKSGVPRGRYEVIPNGVDLGRYAALPARDEARRALGVDPGRALVLHAARLKPQKNQRLLVDAAAALARSVPSVELAVVGDGSERAALEAHAASAGAPVRFFGFRKDVETFLAAADAFCLTSDREGFPNSLVEALAAGLPVVTTDVPGAAEILAAGEGHARLAPREASAVASALAAVLADGARDRAAQAARCRAAAGRFSLAEIADRYAALFRRVSGM
jgi:glycosyltransferase involved in cell wall biosynthesis